MRILTALTYYHPYYSGLTIYAERLARALVGRGHQVTVLTSRYDRILPASEVCEGVQIIRSPVLMNISKGVLMPTMFYWAWINIRKADIVHLHLPQLDAAYITLICRLLNKPVVLTYHCDLLLPPGFIHSIANQISHLANKISMLTASQVVVNTLDYAERSSFLRRYLQKIRAIFPPVELVIPTMTDEQALQIKAGLEPGQWIIGMVARLAAEKGWNIWLRQCLNIKEPPTARCCMLGNIKCIGEETYIKTPTDDRCAGDRWTFRGIYSPGMAAFYRRCDVTVLPSTNSTESFGIVQIESMSVEPHGSLRHAWRTPASKIDRNGARSQPQNAQVWQRDQRCARSS
jgi:glycosyltransferase involved in cell wall biosynthesis